MTFFVYFFIGIPFAMTFNLKHCWTSNIQFFPDLKKNKTFFLRKTMTYSNLVNYTLVSRIETFTFYSMPDASRICRLLVSILIFMTL